LKNRVLSFIGLVLLVSFTLMVSGCTSDGNNSTKSYASDIVTSGDLSGQWNGPLGVWFINGNL